MEEKQNCWEFKKCGLKFVCPVVTAVEYNGRNGGKNGGRICWQIAGTFCGGKVQGMYAEKQSSCLKCDFARRVFDEEGKNLKFL